MERGVSTPRRVQLCILHISTRLILGGSQENTVLSCEGQARLGHDVHLAFGPIYGPEGSLLDRVERFNERCSRGEERTASGESCRPITTHVVPNLVRQISPISDYRAYCQLRRLIDALRPDIVHTHSSKAGILGRAAAWDEFNLECRRDPCPPEGPTWMCGIVHTIHGPPFHDYQSRFIHRLYVLSERFAARRCHTIVSVADAMTRQYLREGIGRAEQYRTVYSGMETECFLNAAPGESRGDIRARLGFTPDDFVIGTVARLAELKGHDDLLEALADRLRSDPRWKLMWVGDGWWREKLIARAEALGLRVEEGDRNKGGSGHRGVEASSRGRASIILTGLVPPQRVPSMIRAMDVLAHPSFREGLPRTVPQALLCGVCPVAYDVDGTGEACRDGETGLLVKAGDRAGLRAAIERLYDHPDERRAMAERGRDECRERFSARAMVGALERVYASVVNRGDRGNTDARSHGSGPASQP